MHIISVDNDNNCLNSGCRFKTACSQYERGDDRLMPIIFLDIDSKEIVCKSTKTTLTSFRGRYEKLKP
jgi:hypothetical protein